MYEYLRGRIASRTPARLVLDVGGVGYDLIVPAATAFASDGEATIWTHLVVREDAHTLYGFPDREGRELFRLLLKVKGVGPTMAISLLSGLRPSELVAAVIDENSAALTRVKGVGRKTADQILLDLRDRVGTFEIEPTAGGTTRTEVVVPSAINDARAALTSIGFTDKEAVKAVDVAAKKVGTDDVELLIRTALAP
ncbi:MAG: Holliday junction branch migration protein RuvA [Planctomycetota bacterium]